MARIAGLFCLLCGFISSGHGDPATTTEQPKCGGSSTVQALTPSVVSSTYVTLIWEAPKTVCGDIDGYDVSYWQVTRASRRKTYTRTSYPTVTIGNLEPNTAYTFTVVAISRNLSGAVLKGDAASVNATTIHGDPATTTEQPKCEGSSTVQALTQSVVSSTSVTLLWEVPNTVCGNIGGYDVSFWQVARPSLGKKYTRTSHPTATISNLEPNTAYTFTVVAISRNLSGGVLKGDAASVNATTNPGPVTLLTVKQQNTRSVKISWNAPQNSKKFEVCVIPTPPDWISCGFTTDLEYAITGLNPETTYTIEVAAVRMNEQNTVESRGAQQTINATTICERSSAVQNLTYSVVNSTSVTLRWKAPLKMCGNLDVYDVSFWQTASASSRTTYIRATYQSGTIGNLEPNTAHTFTVCAISRDPSGTVLRGDAAVVNTITDPGPVTGLTVMQQNSRSVILSWKAPQNSELFEICAYNSRRRQKSCQFHSILEYTMLGLEPETSYSISAAAVRMNLGNTVEARGAASIITSTTICDVSENVQLQQSLFAGGSSYIVLAWTPPRKVCGVLVNILVSFFEKTATSTGKPTEQHNFFYEVSTTRANITALTANTFYNFTVSALTREPSGSDTSGASHSVELRTAPARVNHLEKMRVTSDSFEARWTAPHSGYDHGLFYHLNLYLLWHPFTRELKQTTSNTTIKFDQLEPESAYRLEVSASRVLTAATRSYGDIAFIDILTDCSSPSKPQLTINGFTSDMDMRVSWQHDASGCLNVSYIIFMTFFNGTSHFETSYREFVIRDLRPYTNYSVIVSAVRSDGLNRRAYSNSSTVDVSSPAAAPHEITLLSTKNIDSSSAIVVWEPPTTWNGQPGGYVIALVQDNGTLHTFYTKNVTDTEHNFLHLQPSTYYEVQLIAFNNLINSSVKILNFTTAQLPVSALISTEIEIVIPAIIAVVLIAAVAILIGLWVNRRRSTPGKASSQELSPLTRVKTDGRVEMNDKVQQRAKHNPQLLVLAETACGIPQDDVYGNAAAVGISLATFPTFVRSELSESAPFAAEFKALKSSIASLQTAGLKPSNKTKNKFKDIIPYDESRVVLTPKSAGTDTDYINASFIEGYGGKPRCYIAAQGPTNDTMEDFWRMVLEYRSEVIVMVTRLFEAGVTKCAWYWPESGTKVCGNIEVTLLSSDEFPDYQIHVLQVVQKSDGSRLTVKHFYYTSWPDHGVPDYALSMLKFRRNVIAFSGSTDSPTVVHCSAGVGRTGTYIAIDYLLNEARDIGRVNVRLCVERMREQRPKMVQTREQYAFIYQAVMEATQAGDTSIACERFCSYYKKLTENSNELLRKEYEIFAAAIQPLTRESCSAALLPENSKKNVSPEILPANQKRPILVTRSNSEDGTDYINAVFLNTSKKKDGYIVTQTPLPHTKGDFWRMVLDYRVGTIIALDSFTNKNSLQKYWPEMGQDFLLGDALSVSCARGNPDSGGSVRTRDFRVNRVNGDGFAVRQFEFLSWPLSDPCPKDESSLMELISSIDKWTAQAEAGTILVHCSNGAKKSGLLVAAMNALRCAEAEQVIDVYITGLLLRQHRPQLLCNVEQYHFLYKIMASYVETFDTYSNFLPSTA